jgi:hypothetical protein
MGPEECALVVIDAKTQQMIGSSRFYGYDKQRSEVGVGWTFLARSRWGGSYNGEMKQLMLRQRSVERFGAIRTGWRRDGSGRDSYLYEVSASTLHEDELA